jgi:hypothetical protein
MILRVALTVKFRSFGVTWGTVSRAWQWVLPPVPSEWADIAALELPDMHFNERGVKLDVWVE